MRFETSSGVSLHVDVFGDAAAPPLLLIHGSTLTGWRDYGHLSNMVERFSRRYRVILPDCRGHGRSQATWTNGRLDYSFSQMAADLAELLRGLGAAPAFVAGHSNGGNVALFMAKEQPAVTRAAVLLAANAYIDAHVRRRVPVGMDPERVAVQSPEWMNEMIELHDSTHGNGYWRHLLQATILETITTPDWTREDLKDVNVPCLCVQGELDRTNAPGRHAQVLSEWLPRAELWVPEGIGHSVHHELPDAFEQRVIAFFEQVAEFSVGPN